jgi:hypothetical protein
MRSILILVIAGLLQAQDKPAEPKPEPREAAIIPVKTLTGDSFDRLVRLLNVFNAQAQFSGDKNLRTIVVYAPKDVVEQMRKVVAELDRPGSEAAIGRNIDMTMTFLKCSSAKVLGAPAPLPADLESVAKQLRAATQYKNIEVWDVVPLRLQEGKVTDQSERLPGAQPGGAFPTLQIVIRPESVGRKDQGRYVRFDQVKIGFRMPVVTGGNQVQYMDVGMTTSGDFMEGQKTVLGKVSGMDEDSAIFVVIALKVLD